MVRPKGHRRLRAAAIVALVTGAGVASVVNAATLGGLRVSTLAVFGGPAEVDTRPLALGCDDFGNRAGPLDGRGDDCGNTWATSGSTWQVSEGVARATGRGGAALVEGLPTNQVTVSADLIDGHRANRRGGVVHSHTVTAAGPAHLVGYMEGPGRLRLDLVVGSTTVALASADPVPVASPQRVAVRRVGADVTVSVEGVPVIAHTLLPARAGLLSGTGAGLWKAQGPPAEFGSFSVVSP